MKLGKMLAVYCVFLFVAGCTTTGHFKVPEDTQLYIYERPQPVAVGSDGAVTTSPFFWTAAGLPPHSGIPYRLEKNGKIVKEGHLRAKFRVVSIFWPPLAAVYWPMGFNPNVNYDLINDTQN